MQRGRWEVQEVGEGVEVEVMDASNVEKEGISAGSVLKLGEEGVPAEEEWAVEEGPSGKS